ncbi:MAG: SRPBCC domain-containing protein [Flavobacteriales bacterium]
MALKTQLQAPEGKQEIVITRDFDIPVQSLFKAYIDPQIVEHWMSTKVVKLENKAHGSWHFITTDPMGNEHGFNGTIHEFVTNEKITRTFEMEGSPFPVQLEFLEFSATLESTSKLSMHIIYKTLEHRDQMLKLPFAQGLNMAHNRLEEFIKSSN